MKPKRKKEKWERDILDVIESVCYGLLIAFVGILILVFLYNHNWLPIITFT